MIRGVIDRPLRSIVILVVLVVAGAVAGFQTMPNAMPTLGFSLPSFSGRALGGAPSATENYLRGTEAYNAEMVWTALSDEAQLRYRTRGGNLQSLQAQMEQAKQAGAQLSGITYIGGQSLPDGSSMHFYLVSTRSPQTRGEAEFVPYVFTLDKSGKIAQVQ
jgi:hypothetical protein